MSPATAVEFDAAAKLSENESSGPVAQLGARFHGMEEVVGSIPTRSTKFPNNLIRAAQMVGPEIWPAYFTSKRTSLPW